MTKYREIIRLAQPELKLSQQKIALSCGVSKKTVREALINNDIFSSLSQRLYFFRFSTFLCSGRADMHYIFGILPEFCG